MLRRAFRNGRYVPTDCFESILVTELHTPAGGENVEVKINSALAELMGQIFNDPKKCSPYRNC